MNKSIFYRQILKLGFTATLADLFYIVANIAPPKTIDEIRYMSAVPEMLTYILMSAALLLAFGSLTTYITKHPEQLY